MIKPNPQIELHPAYMWICDECGTTNFERCTVRSIVISEDDIEEYADSNDQAIAEISDDFDESDIDELNVEELLGEMDSDDDNDSDDECDECDCEQCVVGEYSVPRLLECPCCGANYDDVVLSG
jgi:hypothetical protein